MLADLTMIATLPVDQTAVQRAIAEDQEKGEVQAQPIMASAFRRTVPLLLIGTTVAAVIGVTVSARTLEPRLHAWVTSTLSRSLESEIQLEAVRLTWMPLRLHARNLIVRHHGRTDVPPLLVVSKFTVDLRATDLWSLTVDRVWVDGLEINIPPKDPKTGERPLPNPSSEDNDDSSAMVVRRLTATNGRLALIPRDADQNPRVWDIHELDLTNLRSGEPAAFTAALINPIPYGNIESRGHFGPGTPTSLVRAPSAVNTPSRPISVPSMVLRDVSAPWAR